MLSTLACAVLALAPIHADAPTLAIGDPAP